MQGFTCPKCKKKHHINEGSTVMHKNGSVTYECGYCDYSYTSSLFKGRVGGFGWPETKSFPCWLVQNEHWNGWACPSFSFASAKAMLKYIVQKNDELGYTSDWKYDKKTDTFAYDNNDEKDAFQALPEEYVGHDINTPLGAKHVYDIGSHCWCWELR